MAVYGRLRPTPTTFPEMGRLGDDAFPDDGNAATTSDVGLQVARIAERPVQESNPANTAPKFEDQDLVTVGDQSDTATRSVKENQDAGETVGNPLTATDGDLLLYALSGSDAANFEVDGNGQITTDVELDYEAQSTHTVVLNATDPSGAVDSILVTINVTDENDDAEIAGASAIDYAENGAGPVATFTANDQDGDAIAWSSEWRLMPTCSPSLGGALDFQEFPQLRRPAVTVTPWGPAPTRNVYSVMVIEATGGDA